LRQKYKKKNLIQAAGYIVLKWLNFQLKLGNNFNFTCKNVCKTCWYLVGLEKFLMDLMLEADYIDPLPDKIQEIKNEIKRRSKIFGKNGAYIVALAHNIQDDTSIENIMAFFDALKG
jgi:hypothetical protein